METTPTKVFCTLCETRFNDEKWRTKFEKGKAKYEKEMKLAEKVCKLKDRIREKFS